MRQFNLDLYINYDVVDFQVNQGTYGIKQVGLLANGGIVEHLTIQSKYVPYHFLRLQRQIN